MVPFHLDKNCSFDFYPQNVLAVSHVDVFLADSAPDLPVAVESSHKRQMIHLRLFNTL